MSPLLKINTRIDTLRTAIAYSRYHEKHMSIGEGIMCNQEIASWFSVIDERTEHPKYVVPEKIESKVIAINRIVNLKNWENPHELL